MELQPHQQRVVEEKKELDIKIKALQTFIERNEMFYFTSTEEKSDMRRQLHTMETYSQILQRRINRFI